MNTLSFTLIFTFIPNPTLSFLLSSFYYLQVSPFSLLLLTSPLFCLNAFVCNCGACCISGSSWTEEIVSWKSTTDIWWSTGRMGCFQMVDLKAVEFAFGRRVAALGLAGCFGRNHFPLSPFPPLLGFCRSYLLLWASNLSWLEQRVSAGIQLKYLCHCFSN